MLEVQCTFQDSMQLLKVLILKLDSVSAPSMIVKVESIGVNPTFYNLFEDWTFTLHVCNCWTKGIVNLLNPLMNADPDSVFISWLSRISLNI